MTSAQENDIREVCRRARLVGVPLDEHDADLLIWGIEQMNREYRRGRRGGGFEDGFRHELMEASLQNGSDAAGDN